MTDSVEKIGDSKSRGTGPMASLLKANQLDYSLPPNLSVVVKRTLIRNFFNKTSYQPNETLTAILNSGDLYASGRHSYLTFEVKVTPGAGATATTFGRGSALNVIRDVLITSSSGTEVERVQAVNVFRCLSDRWSCSEDWLSSYGSVMGYGAADDFNTTGTVRFCIPMSRISGLWNCDKLLPSGLIGGMRIDITLETPSVAFESVGATAPPSYTIENPSIMLDTYQLSDSILRRLNAISAANALEVVFETYDHTSSSTSTTALNTDVKKAVSRAQWVVTKSRTTAASLDPVTDSLASEPTPFSAYQYNLSGLYFPSQSLTTDREFYQNAAYTFGKGASCKYPTSVSVLDFETAGDACMGATLERSAVLGLSGLPVASSRVLSLNATLKDATARTHSTFMAYIKVAKVFISRVVIRE